MSEHMETASQTHNRWPRVGWIDAGPRLAVGFCCFVLLMFSGLPAPVQGSAHLRYSLSSLVERSTMVALVLPESRISRRIRSQDGRRTLSIVTDVTVRLERSLKGPHRTGERVVVRLLGGQVGDLGLRVTGAARLPGGVRQLIFVDRRAEQRWYQPVGMSQGAMPVERVQGSDWVRPAHSDLVLLEPQLATAQRPPRAAPIEAQPLEEMVRRIQQLLGQTP